MCVIRHVMCNLRCARLFKPLLQALRSLPLQMLRLLPSLLRHLLALLLLRLVLPELHALLWLVSLQQ